MARRYFTLLARDAAAPWRIEFGAWDRADVDSERDDYRDHGYRAGDLKIIITNGQQASIDAEVAKLNGEQPIAGHNDGSGYYYTLRRARGMHGFQIHGDDNSILERSELAFATAALATEAAKDAIRARRAI